MTAASPLDGNSGPRWKRPTVSLTAPTICMVLAAIAAPIEFRPPIPPDLTFGTEDPKHFLANVIGFVPVGVVLGHLGWLRAVITAAAMTVLAETGQLVVMHRDPSLPDVLANLAGAIAGTLFVKTLGLGSLEFPANRAIGALAGAMAAAVLFVTAATPPQMTSSRGWTTQGQLEAHWTFDEDGVRVLDSSANELHGELHGSPKRVPGQLGTALLLDGKTSYADIGRSEALSLRGSMTISAWINSRAFPADDAAVVSQFHSGAGYQFDTTIDTGPRAIGFKLTNACGDLIARYGKTPLMVDTWYHIAGVYDADARTIDVYLNGEVDNGLLDGEVTATQRSSRGAVHVGKRTDMPGAEFDGLLDDVRVYSLALGQPEIQEIMGGSAVSNPGGAISADKRQGGDPPCAMATERYEMHIPLAAAVLGVLTAFAFVGLLPGVRTPHLLAASAIAGALLLAAARGPLPSFNLVSVPLVSLAGGAAVALSTRR